MHLYDYLLTKLDSFNNFHQVLTNVLVFLCPCGPSRKNWSLVHSIDRLLVLSIARTLSDKSQGFPQSPAKNERIFNLKGNSFPIEGLIRSHPIYILIAAVMSVCTSQIFKLKVFTVKKSFSLQFYRSPTQHIT